MPFNFFRRKRNPRQSPSGEPSPMEIYRLEADAVNLLGTNDTVSLNERTADRISYEDAQRIREAMKARLLPYVRQEVRPGARERTLVVNVCTPPPDEQETYTSYLEDAVRRLANDEVGGWGLGEVRVEADILAHGWYHDNQAIIPAEGVLKDTATVAHGLVMALGVLRGNLPPNDLGYIPGAGMSLYNKSRFVGEELMRARNVLVAQPELFGGSGAAYFNAISDIATTIRPTFMGDVVGEPFPRIEE